MSGPAAAVQDPAAGLPRNSSIDSAISAISSKTPPKNGSQEAGASDVASLIKKAGSPEALILSLLKDKNSQSQQNSQLWRLVDKQRAMILGLNKDLERALQDKEKYRTKLKDIMANPAVSKAAGVETGRKDSQTISGHNLPRIDVDSRATLGPDSPTFESESRKQSPIDAVLAPYPITPPSDHFTGQATATTDPSQTMPKPHEHAYGKYDHEADDRAAGKAQKEKQDEQLRDLHFNSSLPPSRGLPPDPPKGPPPKPPTRPPPSVSVVEATPRADEGFSTFPAPPRKAPPAPLQLKREPQEPAQDEETDSDLDDILDAAGLNEKRGRRRTRAEDDRNREIRAWKEASGRSASKKSNGGSKPDSPVEALPPSPRTVPQGVSHEAGTASLDAVLQGDECRDIGTAMTSPGLPASPRPNMKAPLHSPPISPRTMGSFPAAPLSPRPPRQPIPLPPNTPLATPAAAAGDAMSNKPHAVSGTMADRGPLSSSTKNRDSPTERTRIYKGLVTDEFPELLLPPNALPSIAIQVASSRMKPSRASLISLTQLEEDPVFTLAIISRSDGGELWRVEKDSASLAKLDSRMKQCTAFTALAPDRNLFTGHAPAKVDARRIALEQYMDEVLNTPFDIATALELCKYLSTNTLPPNSDETGGSSGSAEGSAHMIGPDGRPIRSGYLTKRGKNFGGWKSRFFLLDGPLLKYYETPGGAHLGTIKLQNAQIGKQSQNNDNQSPTQAASGEDMESQYRHAFLILEPKKKDSSSHVKHVLCAESDRERDLWVDALLQWIDYREPDDDEPPPNSKANGHAKSGSGRHGGGKSKKGSGDRVKSSHQPSDSDTLVGVRYDSTQAGDAPQSTSSGRPKTSAGPGDHANFGVDTMSSQANVISGPKDPQPISDSAAWGNKTNLAAPSHEEKKARKRSFFGFGPKTRSNSDGQDTIPPVGDLHSSTPPPPSGQPARQVFGAQLAEAVRFNPPTDVQVPLPSVVYRCVEYLDSKDAVLEEGIFRLSGSNIVIKQLRERFNNEGDVNLARDEQFLDIHAVASLLKLYLRELPTTILTRDLHMDFLATIEIQDRREKLAALGQLAQKLPLANATLLKYLIAFLIKIINNSDLNKMTVRNVGIVFSPTLNIPAPVFAMFLQNYEPIFGIAPEEYELPTGVEPDGRGQGQYDAQGRFEPPPVRPSTSSGNPSPHRQPRIDSMRDYQRSTPTPPLSNLNPARGSPTPPLGQAPRSGYEQSYYAQPGVGVAPGRRPTYDSGRGTPPQHDGYNLYPSGRGPPGYDRAQYQQNYDDSSGYAVQEQQAYGPANRSRRESSMYMGGLQHQGSKSRLREETRY